MSSGELRYHRRWKGDEEVLPTDFRWNGRPLVVIDPEDPEQVERLVKAYEKSWTYGALSSAMTSERVNALTAGLRSLMVPPKPAEPTNRYAVVLDVNGEEWLRDKKGNWWNRPQTDALCWRKWDDIAAVKVLSEGVS